MYHLQILAVGFRPNQCYVLVTTEQTCLLSTETHRSDETEKKRSLKPFIVNEYKKIFFEAR